MRAQKIVITSAVSTALLLISALSLAAEEITLEQAIINTITQNPKLQAFGYELRAQDGVILQAGLSPKPELTVTVEDVLGTGVAQALSGAQTTASISCQN